MLACYFNYGARIIVARWHGFPITGRATIINTPTRRHTTIIPGLERQRRDTTPARGNAPGTTHTNLIKP
jgi:hypothetical protein